MADVTKIEWADSTLNFWIGCTQVSPACDHCYAMAMAHRWKVIWNGPPKRTEAASWNKAMQFHRGAKRFAAKIAIEEGEPRRRSVFVNSLSDFFDNRADQAWRLEACDLMEEAHAVNFLLVTKRPQNIHKMVPALWHDAYRWPANVWVLTTVEDQKAAIERIPHLLNLRGPQVIGLSMEPLLESVDLKHIVARDGYTYDALIGWRWKTGTARENGHRTANKVGWVIAGGESGKNARIAPPDAFKLARDQALAAGVPFLFKQWGEWVPVFTGMPASAAPLKIVRDGRTYKGAKVHVGDGIASVRVGVKKAGRTLEGELHDGFPAARYRGFKRIAA